MNKNFYKHILYIMDKDNLSEKEKEEARQNGFVLAGKTGAGKTTLLNAIFGKDVGS